MSIGNKILSLRKKANLSQEELAEKVDVTRQTISKWELDETSPDIKQAKSLSKIFNVSLDELTDNDIKNIIVEKVSNTEALAGLIIKIIKIIGCFLIGFFVLFVLLMFFSIFIYRKQPSSGSSFKSVTMDCKIQNNEYEIVIGEDNYFECFNCTNKMNVYLKDIIDWANTETSIENVKRYFVENGGSCE